MLSSLAFITTSFQQNCHINQLMVTTDEIVGFACYCRDYSNARPATIFVWFVPSRKIVLPLSQEAPSIRKTRLALMTSSALKLSAFQGSYCRLDLPSSLKTASLFGMAFLSPCPMQKHNRQRTFVIIQNIIGNGPF